MEKANLQPLCRVLKAPLMPFQFLRLTPPRITRRRSLKRLLTSGTSNSRTSQFPNQRKSRALLAHSCLFAWGISMPVSRIDHVAILTDAPREMPHLSGFRIFRTRASGVEEVRQELFLRPVWG